MLPRLRFIQVGDIHLPSAAKASRNLDQKDRAFPVGLRNMISSLPVKVVFRQIYATLEAGTADAIVFMGDFTDLGSLINYERTVEFLANSLQLGSGRQHARIPVGIIPGNHDINRDLAKEPSLIGKFAPLNEALVRHKLPPLPVEISKTLHIGVKPAGADVVLMNSCWGCGATEFIPAEFRQAVSGAIDAALEGGLDVGLQAYYDRQLDTPAFSDRSISELIELCTNHDTNRLIVVAAHHNLLPQRLTRLAHYTELVNSGALRSSLLEASRPIIYLHGHIHEDPIELVSWPEGGMLVCISAPAAADGFNIIEVVFTSFGMPLVCHVTPWRFDQSGIFRQRALQSAPLIGRRRRFQTRALARLYSYLLQVGECFWEDLLTQGSQIFETDAEIRLQECIELLASDGTIQVENYSAGPESWIIAANI